METREIRRITRVLMIGILMGVALHVRSAGASAQVDIDINIDKELLITDLQVIEDPVRTNPQAGEKAVWTFKYLIEQMAGDTEPSDFVMHWLMQWTVDQNINGSHVPARSQIWDKVIEPWLVASGGKKLDLTLAPFKLLAIVNRMDLRAQKSTGKFLSAGEGRFVFGVLDKDRKPLPPVAGPAVGGFTVIFEYKLIASEPAHVKDWARRWHALGRSEPGSQAYNKRLENITKRFSHKRLGIRHDLVNHSPLNQVRTNEIALSVPWEMREFVLDPNSGQLVQHTVTGTPDFVAFNGTPEFAQFINDNDTALLDGSFVLPEAFHAAAAPVGPFTKDAIPGFDFRTFSAHELAPGVFRIPWSAAGIGNNDARHAFAMTTCGGCHGLDETGTPFLHVGFPPDHRLPDSLGSPAQLSGYLMGVNQLDPVDGETIRHFNELERRKTDFIELLDSFDPQQQNTASEGNEALQ